MTDPHPESERPTLGAVQAAVFLAAADLQRPGWSDAFGGPAGVAQLVPELQSALHARLAELRSAAVVEMLSTQSGGQVATTLGISRQSVHKLANAPQPENPIW